MEPGKEQICVNIFKRFKLRNPIKIDVHLKGVKESLMFLTAQSKDATTILEMGQSTQKSA